MAGSTLMRHRPAFHVAVAKPAPRLCFTTLTRGDKVCVIGVTAQGVVMRVFALFFATLFLSNGWALAASILVLLGLGAPAAWWTASFIAQPRAHEIWNQASP